MTAKVPKIGLGQAHRLCQMRNSDRLEFIAEGLPIILRSAQGFWQAAEQLSKRVREAEVLARHAEEEAAKVLILMDMVRCPEPLLASRIGDMVKWFYSHLARLIYAEAVSWRPTHVEQLREYVDSHRKSHDLDGAVGEYIVPNWAMFSREGVLYADVAEFRGEDASWNDPAGHAHESLFPVPCSMALKLAEAMSLLGMFKLRGLEIAADTWGVMDFREKEGSAEAETLTQRLINRLITEELPSDQAEQEHVRLLFNMWQLPMYRLDFQLIPIPLEDLLNEQDRMLWDVVGGDYY